MAFAFGEPHVDDAIALEEAAAAHPTHDEIAPRTPRPSEPGMVEISRDNQKSLGLLTGMAVDRDRARRPRRARRRRASSAGSVAVGPRRRRCWSLRSASSAVALVPFLKYPATPPAVGNPDTIGDRTSEYFAMLLISVLAAIAAVVVARRLRARFDGVTAGLIVAGGYVAVVVGRRACCCRP